MKQIVVFIAVALMIVAFVGCSTESDPTRSDILKSSIIDIPGCLSAHGSSAQMQIAAVGEGSSPVVDVYEGIRETIGSLEEWTEQVKEIVEAIYIITGFDSSGDWTRTQPDPSDPNGPYRVVWGPDTEEGYDYKILLYWDGDLGFEAFVTITEAAQTAKGILTWDFSVIPDSDTDAMVQYTFDATAEPVTLEIKAVDIDHVDPEEPVNAWVSVTLDSNHVIRLSGNYYFQGIEIFEEGDPEDRNYVFTAIGYDEEGMDPDHMNQAILNLAIPTSDISETTSMWDTHSVGRVFAEAIKVVWEFEGITITEIETWTGFDFSASEISELTHDDVIDILLWAAENTGETGASEFTEVLFVLKLVNPAYYMENGFFGTWDGERGTLNSADDIPASFNDLDIDSVNPTSPAAVRDLTVSFVQ
jgi:hypothetical protein